MFLVDILSGAYLVHSTSGEEDHSEMFTIDRSMIEEEEVESIDMSSILVVSEETWQKLRQASGMDEVIEKGWPDRKDGVPYRL